MPSLNSAIQRTPAQADIIRYNNQKASFSMPAIPKVAFASSNDGAQLTLLEAVQGKSYVIQAVKIKMQNTAGTTGTYTSVGFYDFWSGSLMSLQDVDMAANVADTQSTFVTGLNVMTYPGKPVIMTCNGVPFYKSANVYYQEVDQ